VDLGRVAGLGILAGDLERGRLNVFILVTIFFRINRYGFPVFELNSDFFK